MTSSTDLAMIFLEDWNNQPKAKTEALIKEFKDGDKITVERINNVCSYYPGSPLYGNQTAPIYKICCELVDYCSFYKQLWFYLVCAGVALLIIIALIVVSCCCCCKKRGGGGKEDLEVAEESSDSVQEH